MLNRTITVFAPLVPSNEADTLKDALEANKAWKDRKQGALASWAVEKVRFKQESDKKYLEGREALLFELTGKLTSAIR
jgi:hypothetical protein